MESPNDRHEQVECTVCFRKMRSDNLKRHMRKHRDLYSLDENEIREEIKERKRQYEDREERKRLVREIAQQENAPLECIEDQTVKDTKGLKEELLQDNQEYLDKIELGKDIALIINEGVVQEESLTRVRKEALDLFRKQMPKIDVHLVELRPWQQTLMEMTAQPSQRKVLWIWGSNGNEGKSWFQSYLQTFYGYARVVRLDLRNKTPNIMHALSKRPLQTTDIFLFNDTRASGHIQSKKNYAVLEHIKDGSAISSKYNSDVLTFKTPNLLIVFSNSRPNKFELSDDRWAVYSINKNGLKDLNK